MTWVPGHMDMKDLNPGSWPQSHAPNTGLECWGLTTLLISTDPTRKTTEYLAKTLKGKVLVLYFFKLLLLGGVLSLAANTDPD